MIAIRLSLAFCFCLLAVTSSARERADHNILSGATGNPEVNATRVAGWVRVKPKFKPHIRPTVPPLGRRVPSTRSRPLTRPRGRQRPRLPLLLRDRGWKADVQYSRNAYARGDLDGAYGYAKRGWQKLGPMGRRASELAEYMVRRRVNQLKKEVKRCLVEAFIYTAVGQRRDPESCLRLEARFSEFVNVVRLASYELSRRLS